MAHSCTFILVTSVLMFAAYASSESTMKVNESSRIGQGLMGEFDQRMIQEDENDVTEVDEDSSRKGRGVVGDFVKRVALECMLSGDWKCVQTKTLGAFSQWFTKGTIDESKKQQLENVDEAQDDAETGEDNEVEEQRSMVHQVAEALYQGASAIFVAKNEKERQSMVQRGSRALDTAVYELTEQGRKKNKKGSMALVTKLIMLKSAIFTKISTLIQLKTFIVAKLLLIIEAAKLLMSLKNNGGGDSMQEHTEHQIGPDRSDTKDRMYIAHSPVGYGSRKQQPFQYEQIYY